MITTEQFGTVESLPYPWRIPATEVLEWATDVRTFNDGTEERIRIRNAPRQSFSFVINTTYPDDGIIFNKVYNNMKEQWAVPNWTQGETVSIGSGEDYIDYSNTYSDLWESSVALLWQSSTQYEFVDIQHFGVGYGDYYGMYYGGATVSDFTYPSTGLKLATGVSTTYTNALLIPVRIGRVGIEKSSIYINSDYSFTFVSDDNQDNVPSAPDQYLSNDIYYYVPRGSVTDSFDTRMDLLDNTTGIVDKYTPWNNTKFIRQFQFFLKDRTDISDFRSFLYRREGRYRAFWLPTHERNLRISDSGTITTSLDIIDDGNPRSHIAFKLKYGGWVIRAIDSYVESSPGILTLTLSSALNKTVNQIEKISYLGLYRLNTDRVEINWIRPNQCQATVPFIEIEP